MLRPPSNPQRRARLPTQRAGGASPEPVAGAPPADRRTVMFTARVNARRSTSPTRLRRQSVVRTRTWTASGTDIGRERSRQAARDRQRSEPVRRWANTRAAAERGPPLGDRRGGVPRQPLPGTRKAWPQRVGWLSRRSGVRQARPPQPCTLRLNPPHRRLRRAPRPRRMPSAPRARKWGSAHGCGKPVRSPRMPRTVSSAATPRAISVYDALQLFGTRVHEPRPPCAGEHAAVKADQCDPLGPPAGPAKSRERLFASAQVDDGSARRRVELLLQHTHATNGEEPFARKSTRGKRPIVSRRVRTVQTVLGPSDAAASGLPSDPRGASVVERLGVAVRLAPVGQIGQDFKLPPAGGIACRR